MSKRVGLMVLVASLFGCESGGACPDDYERMGGLCVQTAADAGAADAAMEGDGSTEVDASEVDAAVEVDAAPSCVPHEETCNELDDDCDGVVDEEIKLPSVMDDVDGDGYGDEATRRLACVLEGRVTMGGDCDDHDASRHPSATEVCDGIDQNCTGVADEGVLLVFYRDSDGDGHGTSSVTVTSCAAPAGFVASSDDCDDAVRTTYPGATEICDDVDQDCDGTADDGLPLVTYYPDADGDGFAPMSATTIRHCAPPDGLPPAGSTTRAPTTAASRDCYDSDPRAFPGQTAYFPTAIIGAPATSATRFDFDCNGTLQTRYGYSTCTRVPLGCDLEGALPGFTSPVVCGGSGTLLTECGRAVIDGMIDLCHATTRASVPQECR